MREQASKGLPKTLRARQARTVRLAYRGRTGARWTYSPTVVSNDSDALEVRMLMPLTIGLPVEIETRPDEPLHGLAADQPRIPAWVTGCQCSPDGLFRVRLAFRS
jgi:hypothetical protein